MLQTNDSLAYEIFVHINNVEYPIFGALIDTCIARAIFILNYFYSFKAKCSDKSLMMSWLAWFATSDDGLGSKGNVSYPQICTSYFLAMATSLVSRHFRYVAFWEGK